MWRFVLFGLLQLALTIYAWRRGGWPERTCATATTIALVLGWLIPVVPGISYTVVEGQRMVVDGTLLAIMVAVALYADRFWPMWIAALQALAVAVHAVRGVDRELVPIVYNLLVEQFSWPILAIMWIGAIRYDLRCRAAREA